MLLSHILSILHFMLIYIDVSTARLINADILRVANKYIEGPQWKDALRILKLSVSRSSSLTAPSYSSSVNYPSSIISNIVSSGPYSDCISIASSSFAESEFSSFKQRELPGRTMNFHIDLSQTTIVGYKFIQKRQQMYSNVDTQETITAQEQEQNAVSAQAIAEKKSSNGKDTRIPLEKLFEVKEAIFIPQEKENSSNTLSKQRSTATAQIRIKERLIGLLNRCGQRIGGLPKSPSVIFSQNSDVIECHKSSMASSVEDISATNNDVSNDSKHDDTAHGEFAFFKEFDFLEYELESQEGESLDNFNWGVRRKSLSNLDNSLTDHEKISLEAGGGVSGGGGMNAANSYSTGTLKPNRGDQGEQRTSIVVSGVPPHVKNSQKDDFSSDDEMESVSPLYDAHHGGSQHGHHHGGSHHGMMLHERPSSRPASLISHGSSHSLGSDTDNQFTPTVAITSESSMPEGEHSREESVEQWSTQFIQIISDNTGTTSAVSNQILTLIFRNTFARAIELTKKCCDLLPANSPDTHTQMVSSKFLELLNIVSFSVDFPFIFIDPKLFITVNKLLEDHQYAILELQAHWETFNEKRDSLMAVTEKCSKIVRQTPEGPVVEQIHLSKLCKMMYKMHFQLFLLFESYLKIVELLKSISDHAEVSLFIILYFLFKYNFAYIAGTELFH